MTGTIYMLFTVPVCLGHVPRVHKTLLCAFQNLEAQIYRTERTPLSSTDYLTALVNPVIGSENKLNGVLPEAGT